MAIYRMNEQITKGEYGESYLDKIFSRWYHVVAVPMAVQKMGIDRVFIRQHDGRVYKVEYKTDYMAHRTGNVFIETVSVDRENTPGWAISSYADILVYWIAETRQLFICPMSTLRKYLKQWQASFPYKEAQNETYRTGGIVVPVDVFASACKSGGNGAVV